MMFQVGDRALWQGQEVELVYFGLDTHGVKQ
jgi:hypothetical protein